jgi:hypothetical protein
VFVYFDKALFLAVNAEHNRVFVSYSLPAVHGDFLPGVSSETDRETAPVQIRCSTLRAGGWHNAASHVACQVNCFIYNTLKQNSGVSGLDPELSEIVRDIGNSEIPGLLR